MVVHGFQFFFTRLSEFRIFQNSLNFLVQFTNLRAAKSSFLSVEQGGSPEPSLTASAKGIILQITRFGLLHPDQDAFDGRIGKVRVAIGDLPDLPQCSICWSMERVCTSEMTLASL